MEEKDALKVAKEIEEKRKLPKSVKDGIDKTFFYNNLMAIFMMLYFIIINLSYIYLNEGAFERAMKYMAMIMITVTVVLFEFAYRKDNLKIALAGIELLICSLLSVYIPYIFLYTTPLYRKLMMIIPIFLAVYYIAKTIVVYVVRNLKHKNNLSDVKEIVKYNENKSYIDEESTKTLKENKKRKEEEKKIKQQLEKEKKNKNSKTLNKVSDKNKEHKKTSNTKNKKETKDGSTKKSKINNETEKKETKKTEKAKKSTTKTKKK